MAAKTRSMECPKCKRPGVFWAEEWNTDKHGMEYVLRDARDRLPHVCDGALAIQDLEFTKQIINEMMLMNSKTAVATIADASADAQRSLKSYQYEVDLQAEQLSEKFSQAETTLLAQVPGLVEQKLKELVPVDHNIVIKYDYGNGRSSTHKIPNQRPHKQLEEVLAQAQLRIPTYLVGPAGGGKTTCLRHAAECLGLEFYYDNMGPATSQWDMKGFLNALGDYIEGVLRKPYEFGGVAFLDELDNSNAMVLTALNALIANDFYRFPDKTVERHPDFIFFGAGNTFGRGADRQYVGRQKLDAATLDRFFYIEFEYDEEAEFDWAGHAPWVRYVQALRKSAFMHKMEVVISPRASIYGARMLNAGIPLERVCNGLLWTKMSESDSARLKAEVGVPQMGAA